MKRFWFAFALFGLWGGLAIGSTWLVAQDTKPPADNKTPPPVVETEPSPKLVHLELRLIQVPATFAKKVDEQIRKDFATDLEKKGFVALTSAEVTRLVEAAQTEPNANLMIAPQVTTVDNQAATLKVEEMFALACRPTLSKDGKEMTLTLEANARVDVSASGKAICNFKTTQTVSTEGNLLVRGNLPQGQKSDLTYWLVVTYKVADK